MTISIESVKTVEPTAVSFVETKDSIIATLGNNSKVFFSKLLLKPKKHCKNCKEAIVMKQEKRSSYYGGFIKVWTKFDLDGKYHTCKKPCKSCGKMVEFLGEPLCYECFHEVEREEDLA